MYKPLAAGFALVALTASVCVAAPKVETPGLKKPKISMLFEFEKGTVCRVSTSQGTIVQNRIPGSIGFPQADRKAPASCTLPSGKVVKVTAHHHVPENNRVAGITVYPDGSAYITSSTTDGQLIQLQPTGTVR